MHLSLRLFSVYILVNFASHIACEKFVINTETDCEDFIIPDKLKEINAENNLHDCNDFNISLSLQYDSDGKSISMHFEPIPVNSTCYTFYQVQLVKINLTSNENFNKCVVTDIQYEATIDFLNVDVGTYKVFIIPYTLNFDFTENFAPSFPSHYINITDKPQVGESKEIHISTPYNDPKILLVFVPVISVIFIIGFVWYKKYKSGAKYTAGTHSVENGEKEYDFSSSQRVQILILYSQDEVTIGKVHRLKDVLQKCANFKVTVMDDELDEILIDPQLWIKKNLDYSCKNMGDPVDSDKRIILVEPEKATSKDLHNASVEDGIYKCAISTLHNDWRRCLSDYCHLFVVQFEETVTESRDIKEIVPGIRYIIPQHLLELSFNLSCCEETKRNSFYNKLSQSMKFYEINNAKSEYILV